MLFCTQLTEGMNRFKLLVITIVLIPMIGFSQTQVDNLFNKYSDKEGVSAVNISKEFLILMTGVSDSIASGILSKLEGVKVISIEDSTLSNSINFYKELEDADYFRKNKIETLMEVTKDGDKMSLMGNKANNSKEYSELLFFSRGQNNTFISIKGIISPESVAHVLKLVNVTF